MRYCDCGVTGVVEGVCVGGSVGISVFVAVGGTSVSVAVAGTGTSVVVGVVVGKLGMIVSPGTGVRVGTLGTQSSCPA